MDDHTKQPARATPYGGARLPAEAQVHVDWANAVLSGFIERRDSDGAIRYAAGFMSTVLNSFMRGKPTSFENAARGYALYHQAIALEVGDLRPSQPTPAADTSGYRLAGYSGPLKIVESPCACGKNHNVAIPARPGGAL